MRWSPIQTGGEFFSDFAKWLSEECLPFFDFFTPAEDQFKSVMKRNRIFPFKQVNDDYIWERRSLLFHIGFSLTILLSFLVWVDVSQRVGAEFHSTSFDPVLTTFTIGALWLTLFWAQKRRLVLEAEGTTYYFYIGRFLKYVGQIHNIYIRLSQRRGSNGITYYWLILKGYHIEEFKLCYPTQNSRALEILGRKLAHRLNINYFDSKDVSTRHVIHHTSPTQERINRPRQLRGLNYKSYGRSNNSVMRTVLEEF